MGRKAKIKTIDINAKEWFDKINGNSYFSGSITINYKMKTEKIFDIPFQYGYGDHYRDVALKTLIKNGYFKNVDKTWDLYEKQNIIARYNKKENCLKQELK